MEYLARVKIVSFKDRQGKPVKMTGLFPIDLLQQEKLKKWEHIARSMTPEEKNNPELLEKQTSRIQRIAKGSGTTTTDVRTLIKQYRMLQEMVKSQSAMMDGKLDQKTLMKMARKFGKKKMFRF